MSRLLENPSPAPQRAGRPPGVRRGPPWPVGLHLRALTGVATTMSELLGPRQTNAFGILRYERITEPIAGVAEPTCNVPPGVLRQQLEGLLQRGLEAWPLREVIEHHHDGRPIPSNVFVITFDDGYENVYLNAFPILRELELPATIFLATANLDSPRPFASDEWLEAGSGNVPYTAWRPLTSEEAREMHNSGLIELAAETHRPADFRGRQAELVADLRRAQRVLRERFGIKRASLACRSGSKDVAADSELSAAAEEAGMLCALSTEARLVRPGVSPFAWGRFTAEARDSAASLAAKLNGWHEAVRSLGHTLMGSRANPPARLGSPDLDTERD